MPPKIKIITGPIGAGKTTILNRIKESYKRKEIFVGQRVGFFSEPTDSTVANALLKDMYSMFPLANDQFETLQKYLLAVEANDLCSALSSSSYDIVYFDTSVLFGIVFLQTANDLKIINKETYSNCLTFYYQMISNINFENAEVTILKVIPPIDKCMEQINQRGRTFELGSVSIDYISKLTDKIRSHCVSQVLSRLEKPIKCCIDREYKSNDDLFNDIFFNENPNSIPTPSNTPTQSLQSSHSNLSFYYPSNQEQYFNVQDFLN
ncbi:hypothetical protein ACTFIY_011418 [Dictyostelium cf. discoideum]